MSVSIRDLYPYALAEGEGVGTAYEYFAKRRVLAPLLLSLPARPRVVIAGLPEKYGTSLDFVLVAGELRAELLILDDRASAIDRSRRAVEALGGPSALGVSKVTYEERPLGALASAAGGDLILTCEVLQRVPEDGRRAFVRALRDGGPRGAVFAPNSANRSHLAISGLGGFDEEGLRSVVGAGASTGYVDMPPFPPGITRSTFQREKAKSGWFEATAMQGLELYCRGERFVPRAVKARFAHIVYASWR